MTPFLFILVFATAPDAGVQVKPATQRRKTVNLEWAEATERCRREQPKCKVPYAEFDAPRHPCAGRGARCTEDLMQKVSTQGTWRCGCDECATDAHCGPGLKCGAIDPCSTTRVARSCIKRPGGGAVPTALQPCPAPPVGPDPASGSRPAR